jgi:hypothetical protein
MPFHAIEGWGDGHKYCTSLLALIPIKSGFFYAPCLLLDAYRDDKATPRVTGGRKATGPNR